MSHCALIRTGYCIVDYSKALSIFGRIHRSEYRPICSLSSSEEATNDLSHTFQRVIGLLSLATGCQCRQTSIYTLTLWLIYSKIAWKSETFWFMNKTFIWYNRTVIAKVSDSFKADFPTFSHNQSKLISNNCRELSVSGDKRSLWEFRNVFIHMEKEDQPEFDTESWLGCIDS